MDTSQERFKRQPVAAKARLEKQVEKMLHEAHVKHQKQQLRADPAKAYQAPKENVPKGLVREKSKREIANLEFKPEWFTHLRPHFWDGYVDTLIDLARSGFPVVRQQF